MLRNIFKQYETEFPEQTERQQQFRSFLQNTTEADQLISRKNFIGHITASGILIWRSKSKVLLMRHVGLNDYYQPGGHFETSSESPLDVAKRHVSKALESSSFELFSTQPNPNVPIDIDTHYVPPRAELKEAGHYHHDFRYLFVLNEPTDISDSPKDSSRWENINQLSNRVTFKDLVPKIVKILTEVQTHNFFTEVTLPLRDCPQTSCIAVAHFIPDVYPYLHAVKQSFDVLGLIPKPKSINPAVEEQLKRSFMIHRMSREEIKSGKGLFELVAKTKNNFILFDIGGYFSEIIEALANYAGTRFVGVIEDTENGHQKYSNVAQCTPLRVPVISVARSPLKDNEDFLVGQSILFSTDYVLRQVGQLVQYLQCGVLGYGKIGSSIAHHLLLRGVKPWVYDIDPIKRARSINLLCNAPPRQYIINNADIIFSATGNRALNILDFRELRSGCFIVSVTSADDELDMSSLHGEYKSEIINNHVTKYSSFTNYFYLVNKGNAINFIHNAVLGDWIHLVRGEILHAAAYLLKNRLEPGLRELPIEERKEVVEKWLKVFVDDRSVYRKF